MEHAHATRRDTRRSGGRSNVAIRYALGRNARDARRDDAGTRKTRDARGSRDEGTVRRRRRRVLFPIPTHLGNRTRKTTCRGVRRGGRTGAQGGADDKRVG
eukprot:4678077-Prymnesium_polylepis.1